jgi:DNA modification methylase
MTKPKITETDISKLTPDPNNARKRTPLSASVIRKSIEQFGMTRSIVTDENDVILAGNGAFEEAGQLGIERVIVVETTGNEIVAVKRTNLTAEQKTQYAIADNTASDFSTWDFDILSELTQEIDLSEFFPDDKLNELLESLGKGESFGVAEQREENEEEIAELLDKVDEIESRVKLGEIWQLGRHKLAVGDSTIEGNVRALLGDRIASLIHADPPYGMGKEKDGVLNDNLYRDKLDDFQMKWWRACRGSVADNASAYIWGNAEDLWRLWYKGGLKDSERLTLRNEIVWAKGDAGAGGISHQGMDGLRLYPQQTERCLFFMVGEQGFNNNADNYWDGWENIRVYLKTELQKVGDIKWAKRAAGHSEKSGCHWFDSSQWTMPTEEVYKAWQDEAKGKAFKREYDDLKREYDDLKREYDDLKREYDDLKREWYETRAYFNNTHENMTDVWEYPRVQGEERWGHATPKPVDMIARIYKSSSPDDGVIYSPFLGSGTDIVAGEKLEGDRTVAGFELSEKYSEIILQRFEKLTGIEPKLIGKLPD